MAKATDEEMKDAEPASTSAASNDAAAADAETKVSPTDQLALNLAILEKAVSLKETRMISGRLLRQTAAIRHQLTPQVLSDFVTKALPEEANMGPILLKQLKQVSSATCPGKLYSPRLPESRLNKDHLLQAAASAMDTQDAPTEATGQTTVSTCSLPEAEAYATLVVTQYLVDHKLCSEVWSQAEMCHAVASLSLLGHP